MDVHLVQRHSTSHVQRLRKTSSTMNKSGLMEVRYANGTSRRSPPLMSVDSDYEHGFTSFCSYNMHGFNQGKLILCVKIVIYNNITGALVVAAGLS